MLLVDARGVPLSLIVTAANHHDVTQLVPTLDAIVIARPEPTPRERQHLCADAGFGGFAAEHEIRERDYTPHVRPRGEEGRQRARGKRPRRWVVAVAHSWFTRFRKLLVRYEKDASLLLGSHHASCGHHLLPTRAGEGKYYLRISS